MRGRSRVQRPGSLLAELARQRSAEFRLFELQEMGRSWYTGIVQAKLERQVAIDRGRGLHTRDIRIGAQQLERKIDPAEPGPQCGVVVRGEDLRLLFGRAGKGPAA